MIIFDDLIFPTDIIAYACAGKRKRFTDVATTAAGFTQTNIRWSRTMREFDIGSVARPVPQWEAIATVHEILEGRAYGCLFQDPTDSLVSASEGVLRPIDGNRIGLAVAGAGYGVPTYRLAKRYAFMARSKDVDISKPKSGSAKLLRAGVPVVFGSAAGNVSVDYTTGIATFVADASQAITSITIGTTTHVTLAGSLGLNIGQRLFLTGVTGVDAALLNGLSHPITNFSGSTYFLGTDTSGKTLTATGTGYAYPQGGDTLAWSGSYYVPVAFLNDDLDWNMLTGGREDKRSVKGPSIVLTEQRVA